MRSVGAVGVAVLWALLADVLPGGTSELVTLVQEQAKPESSMLKPKVMIAIVARNAAHSLPHYLGCIERLEYPKERIAIWWGDAQLNALLLLSLSICTEFIWLMMRLEITSLFLHAWLLFNYTQLVTVYRFIQVYLSFVASHPLTTRSRVVEDISASWVTCCNARRPVAEFYDALRVSAGIQIAHCARRWKSCSVCWSSA